MLVPREPDKFMVSYEYERPPKHGLSLAHSGARATAPRPTLTHSTWPKSSHWRRGKGDGLAAAFAGLVPPGVDTWTTSTRPRAPAQRAWSLSTRDLVTDIMLPRVDFEYRPLPALSRSNLT